MPDPLVGLVVATAVTAVLGVVAARASDRVARWCDPAP
jgi:hypothetical protein